MPQQRVGRAVWSFAWRALVGLVALAALLWSALPKMTVCHVSVAHMAVMQIRRAAVEASDGRAERCPAYSDLDLGAELDPTFARGVSDKSVHIECTGEEVIVRWAGSDGRFDTPDDMTIPGGG